MKNKEIYKYLMHMEEVIYDLKRSIDRTRKPKDKDEELWERVKNAAPGEWVCIDPESNVSGFIRYARDAGEMTPPRPINTYGPDFKPAPPKRTMKEVEGETPIQGI